jgi:hypothetical protein
VSPPLSRPLLSLPRSRASLNPQRRAACLGNENSLRRSGEDKVGKSECQRETLSPSSRSVTRPWSRPVIVRSPLRHSWRPGSGTTSSSPANRDHGEIRRDSSQALAPGLGAPSHDRGDTESFQGRAHGEVGRWTQAEHSQGSPRRAAAMSFANSDVQVAIRKIVDSAIRPECANCGDARPFAAGHPEP